MSWHRNTPTFTAKWEQVKAWKILSPVSAALHYRWPFQDVYCTKWQVYIKKKEHTNQTTVHPSAGWGTNPHFQTPFHCQTALCQFCHICACPKFYSAAFLPPKYADMFLLRGSWAQREIMILLFFFLSIIYYLSNLFKLRFSQPLDICEKYLLQVSFSL